MVFICFRVLITLETSNPPDRITDTNATAAARNAEHISFFSTIKTVLYKYQMHLSIYYSPFSAVISRAVAEHITKMKCVAVAELAQ